MKWPRFVDLVSSDETVTFSVNIDHITMVSNTKDPELAWVCLQGDETPLKVRGSRKDVLDLINWVLSQ